MLLEPYSFKKNLLYLVVCPGGEDLANHLRVFFRNLSITYKVRERGREGGMEGGREGGKGEVRDSTSLTSTFIAKCRSVRRLICSVQLGCVCLSHVTPM